MTIEYISFSAKSTLKGNTLSGVAHVYGTRARIEGKTYEVFSKGAFDRVLRDSDVRAFLEHDRGKLLGRQSSGTLRIDASGDGLAYELDLPNTTHGNDVRELVNRGDITEMSFGFVPGKYTLAKAQDGLQIRSHTDVAELVDISPVAIPAFAGTSIELRSASDFESIRSQLIKSRQRVLNRKGDL